MGVKTKLRQYIKTIQKRAIEQVNVKIIPDGSNQHLGTHKCGWMVPMSVLNKDSVCYLFGAGEDVSFDIALAKTLQPEIHIFDPTPRACTHFQQLQDAAEQGKPFPVNASTEIFYDCSGVDFSRITYHKLGLWVEDGIQKMFVPKKSQNVSHSIKNLQKTDEWFEAQVMSLTSIMKSLQHTHVDLIKLDIEGAEIDVLPHAVAARPKIIAVEFDEGYHHLDAQWKTRINAAIQHLVNNGYQCVARNGWDFTFKLR